MSASDQLLTRCCPTHWKHALLWPNLPHTFPRYMHPSQSDVLLNYASGCVNIPGRSPLLCPWACGNTRDARVQMEICLGCVLEVLGVGIFFERFTMSFSLLAVDYLSGVQTTDSVRKTSKTSVNRKPNRNHPSWERFCRDKLLEIAALLAGLVAIRHWEDSSHRTIKCQTASPTAMQWYQESLHKPMHQNPPKSHISK